MQNKMALMNSRRGQEMPITYSCSRVHVRCRILWVLELNWDMAQREMLTAWNDASQTGEALSISPHSDVWDAYSPPNNPETNEPGRIAQKQAKRSTDEWGLHRARDTWGEIITAEKRA